MLSWAVGSASGLMSVVVSVHATLSYVPPPSVETWTKPKSQPSSSFQRASKVSDASAPVGTATSRTIASSRSSAAPEYSAPPLVELAPPRGGAESTVHSTGRGGSVDWPWNESESIWLPPRYWPAEARRGT